MKKILLIALLLSISISGFSQRNDLKQQRREQRKAKREISRTSRGIDDPKAHQVLNAIRKQLKSYTGLKIDFTYLLENKAEKIKDSKKGNIAIKGNKYSLNFMGQNSRSDGKNVWNYNKDAKEVQISEVNPEDADAMNPVAIIDNYEKNYRAKFIREDKNRGNPVLIVDLIPLENRNHHKVRIVSNKAKNTIVYSEIHDKNGSIFTFRVDKMQTNIALSDHEFSFDAANYPGVEVIDMR